jgi:hypothetical protein
MPQQKKRHRHKSILECVRLFLGDSGGRTGLVLCEMRFPSKLDHYDLWSPPGGPPMITCRVMVFASSQGLVRANYLDHTLVLLLVLLLLALLVLFVVSRLFLRVVCGRNYSLLLNISKWVYSKWVWQIFRFECRF